MQKDNEEISKALIDSILPEKTSEEFIDIAEIGLDQLLDDGLLKEIPILKTIVAIYKTSITISDRLLIKKILLFLSSVYKIPDEHIAAFIAEIDQKPKFKREIGEKLLMILDKSDDFRKSTWLAEIFKSYITHEIDYSTFQRLCNSVNNTFIDFILDLKTIYAVLPTNNEAKKEVLDHLYQSGLVSIESQMVVGSNGLEFTPNRLGRLLINILKL